MAGEIRDTAPDARVLTTYYCGDCLQLNARTFTSSYLASLSTFFLTQTQEICVVLCFMGVVQDQMTLLCLRAVSRPLLKCPPFYGRTHKSSVPGENFIGSLKAMFKNKLYVMPDDHLKCIIPVRIFEKRDSGVRVSTQGMSWASVQLFLFLWTPQ